ncbi:MAG: rhodanese-like domain-containing protein [Burkholderiales bacterium]
MTDVDLLKFVTDNIFLVAVAFVSGAMLIWPALRRGAGGAAVSTQEATLMINRQDALVLDVREPAEFEKGHVIGARNVPLSQLEGRVGDLEKHKAKPVIVICASGNRSRSALGAMRRLGFQQVFELAGGVAAWQQAGLPLEK